MQGIELAVGGQDASSIRKTLRRRTIQRQYVTVTKMGGYRRRLTPRLPRTPAVNSHAPTTLTRRLISSMPHSTPTWSTRRLPMRAVWAASCAG
jgi:hypothetical protein